MAARLLKITPRQLAEKFLIDDYVYTNIRVYFGFDNVPYTYTLTTLIPISYTGRYTLIFTDFDDQVLYYADEYDNHMINFIEREICNFMKLIGRTGKLTVNPTYYFDDTYKRRICKDDEFIDA